MIDRQNVKIYTYSAYNESSYNIQTKYTRIKYDTNYLNYNLTSGEHYYDDFRMIG